MKNFKSYLFSVVVSIFLVSTTANAAYDDTGTDYTNDTLKSWIDMGPAMQPLNFTSFLTCLIKQSGASQVVNGTYTAVVNTSACETGRATTKPVFAKLSVTTSRPDNSSPQTVKVWFDAGDGQQYIAEAVVTEGVSTSAPFGSFSFNWQDRAGTQEKGSMSFTSGTSGTTIKMIKNDITNSQVISLNGLVNNDKTTGKVKVDVGSNSYAMSFNSTYVNIQKGSDAAECKNRSSLTEYVFDYNLYNQTTGAKKKLSGPFQCTYDSSGTTKQCYIGPYGGWFEGGETAITSVTHSNGTVYSGITYDANDANNDRIYIVVPGYTFSPPLVFAKSDQVAAVQTAMGSNSYLSYFGENSLYGLPWQCSSDGTTYVTQSGTNCDNAPYWRPSAKLSNATVLTDNTSTQYVTKAAMSMKVMATVASGFCSTLGLTGISTDHPKLSTSDMKHGPANLSLQLNLKLLMV